MLTYRLIDIKNDPFYFDNNSFFRKQSEITQAHWHLSEKFHGTLRAFSQKLIPNPFAPETFDAREDNVCIEAEESIMSLVIGSEWNVNRENIFLSHQMFPQRLKLGISVELFSYPCVPCSWANPNLIY